MLVVRYLSLIFLTLAVLTVSAPVCAKDGFKGVQSDILINAPRAHVWKIVIDKENFAFAFKKKDDRTNEAIIEQDFPSIPLMGQVKTVLKIKVKENEKLDYDLIESNQIKAFSGGWLLTSVNESTTKLHISSYVDPGLPVPRFLVNAFLKGRVNKRLKKAKRLAEASYVKTLFKSTVEGKSDERLAKKEKGANQD
ncbi:MAG: hypothetical protein K8F91_13195 [Candidatus Obscuribacterales bacterium]|nr:hypothetical protein [Candidatus Obscuribacterales bacterium]